VRDPSSRLNAFLSVLRRNRASAEEPVSDGVAHDLRPVLEMQLVENVTKVIFHGVFTNPEALGEFSVGRRSLDQKA